MAAADPGAVEGRSGVEVEPGANPSEGGVSAAPVGDVADVADVAGARARGGDTATPRVEALRVLVEKLTGRRMRVIRPHSLVSVGHTDEHEAAARLAKKREAMRAASLEQASRPRARDEDEALRVRADVSVRGEDGSSASVSAEVSITRGFVDHQGIMPGSVKDGRVAASIDVQVPSSAEDVGTDPIEATLDARSGSRVQVTSSSNGETTTVDLRSDSSAMTTYTSADVTTTAVAVNSRA